LSENKEKKIMTNQMVETKWFREQRIAYRGSIPRHLQNATMLTRYGVRDDRDHRQKRYGRLKIDARNSAKLNVGDNLPFPSLAVGTWHSPVGFNTPKKLNVVREKE
jgi:hypothetical protein